MLINLHWLPALYKFLKCSNKFWHTCFSMWYKCYLISVTCECYPFLFLYVICIFLTCINHTAMGQKLFHTKICPYIFHKKTRILKTKFLSYSIFMKFSALKLEINMVSFSYIYIEFYLYFSWKYDLITKVVFFIKYYWVIG